MKKINYYFILFFFLIFFLILNKKLILKKFLLVKEIFAINYRIGATFFKTIDLEKCEIIEKFVIPPDSTLIIGHAYGNPGNNSPEIQKNISNLINKYQTNIKNIFFSGDVFLNPTAKKWFDLRRNINKKIDLYITPGNHDIGINAQDKKEIFEKSPFGGKVYPYAIIINKINIVLEDSISNEWLISNQTKNLINTSKYDNNLLIRHNIPVSELMLISNSFEGLKSKLPSAKKLSKSFNKPLTIIAGDSGAFPFLPRITCVKKDKLKIIVNGVGNSDGDIILLLNKGLIYKYTL